MGVVGFRFDAREGGAGGFGLSDGRGVDRGFGGGGLNRSDRGASSRAKQASDEGCKARDHVNGVVGGVGGGRTSEFGFKPAAGGFGCRVVHGGVGGRGRSN